MITFDGNIRMKSPRANATASSTYQLGYAEPTLFKFLSWYLERGMTFCDVGANVGAYSLFAAKRVGPTGRVLAFEPAPPIFEYLRFNIDANSFKNVLAFNKALGAQPGSAGLVYEENDLGKSHLQEEGDLRNSQLLEVAVETLDALAAQRHFTTIDYLKIDVEGFELNVLRGASRTIARNPQMVIQTELLPHLARRFALSTIDVADFLRARGFAPHFVDESRGNKLIPFSGARELVGDVIWIHQSNFGALNRLVCR